VNAAPQASANLQPRMTVRDAARRRYRRRPSAVPLPQTDQDCFQWLPGELVIGLPRRKQVVAERLCRGGPDGPKDVLQHGGSGNAA
jgi:hypothetical protein